MNGTTSNISGRRGSQRRGWLAPLFTVAAVACLAAGCTTTQVVTANSKPAIQATEDMPLDLLLDVGILPLDPNIPSDPDVLEEELIIPDVRRAESNFIAYHLKDTLELTGNWGAVRVTPNPSTAVDLELRGRILVSDGEQLKVRMTARDATGRLWLNDTYEDVASKFSYDSPTEDPFQDLYNDIANDLLDARRSLSKGKITSIKQVASIKFAQDLSPDAFSEHLKESSGGKYQVVSLPADNDAMMLRVVRIKEQEYLFVDTLDDHYSRFYRDMLPSYNEWRHATYDEAIRQREMERQARNRLIGGALMVAGGIAASVNDKTYTRAGQAAAAGVVYGGIAAIRSGLNRRKEAEIHAESLKELSQSLGSEIAPQVLEIEGKTIELTGTAEQQYAQWRDLLQQIYVEETGSPAQ